MSNKNLMIVSTLEDIIVSIKLILERFKDIKSVDDFLINDENLKTLDSISMRLIAIGEGFKNIDKLSDKQLLIKYDSIEWQGVKGIRDILSHHYFDLDSEIIFDICENKLDSLLEVSKEMLEEKIGFGDF